MCREGSAREHAPDVTEHQLHHGDSPTFLSTLADQSVKVVYIDPPYGTGTVGLGYRDDHDLGEWTALVDSALTHAARIVTSDGVVAVSIGADRLFELGALARAVFPRHTVTTITVQTSTGVTAAGFRQMSEYLLFITPRRFRPGVLPWVPGVARSPWEGATLASSDSTEWPAQVYPVFVDEGTSRIVGTGLSAAQRGADWRDVHGQFPGRVDGQPAGTVAVWPVTRHGKTCVWRITRPTFAMKQEAGFVKADLPHMPGNPNPFSIKHLPSGVLARIERGDILVRERDQRGAAVFDPVWRPAGTGIPTVWAQKHHRTVTGTHRVNELLGAGHGFAYPKPVGLLTDMLHGAGHRSGTVVDVFAGSGSLFDAVATVNATSNCQLTYVGVTNDESWDTCRARVLAAATQHDTSVTVHLASPRHEGRVAA